MAKGNKMSTIKTTMQGPLDFVQEHGNMSADNLALFTEQFCVLKGRASNGPREYVKLFDVDGNILGRKCSVSNKWLLPAEFNGDVARTSVSRAANKVKSRFVTEAKAMEREAMKLLEEARALTDVSEKLSAFEAYDVAMQEAKTHKLTDCSELVEFADGVEVFDDANALAEHLGVDVILTSTKPDITEPEEV